MNILQRTVFSFIAFIFLIIYRQKNTTGKPSAMTCVWELPLLLWKNCCKSRRLLLHPVILLCGIAALWLQLELFLVLMMLEYIQ